ncbi:MAG TPA: SAM-dependent methyltransferase, partial [Nitrobacter sp.]|nr:SAM-dependent methyltransferase [Nitrobacter sp.]
MRDSSPPVIAGGCDGSANPKVLRAFLPAVRHHFVGNLVAFVTGHEDPDKPETAIDWQALADFPGTLVLYMGVKNLPLIAERLMAAGRDPSQPAAAVQRVTHPDQR